MKLVQLGTHCRLACWVDVRILGGFSTFVFWGDGPRTAFTGVRSIHPNTQNHGAGCALALTRIGQAGRVLTLSASARQLPEAVLICVMNCFSRTFS